MKNLNQSWLLLIVSAIAFLGLSIAWDVYQNVSGGSSQFNKTVTPMNQSTIFTPTLEQHLRSASDFQ